jgi:hypothetical protein
MSKNAAGWYLLEMTVPSTALSSASSLLVGCTNTSTGISYFDDFRFQPTSANTTAYVYDTQTGELTYILGNNNLFVRYQYDAIGRLVRTYREVLGKANIPIASSIIYNFGRNGAATWQNTGNTRCQLVGGNYTGYLEAEQKDMNNLSLTYNQSRWVATTTTSSTCVPPTDEITLTNSTGEDYEINFSGSGVPSQTFSFSTPTIHVLPGTYNVIIYGVGSGPHNNHHFEMSGQATVSGQPRAGFNSVTITLNSPITVSIY